MHSCSPYKQSKPSVSGCISPIRTRRSRFAPSQTIPLCTHSLSVYDAVSKISFSRSSLQRKLPCAGTSKYSKTPKIFLIFNEVPASISNRIKRYAVCPNCISEYRIGYVSKSRSEWSFDAPFSLNSAHASPSDSPKRIRTLHFPSA